MIYKNAFVLVAGSVHCQHRSTSLAFTLSPNGITTNINHYSTHIQLYHANYSYLCVYIIELVRTLFDHVVFYFESITKFF